MLFIFKNYIFKNEVAVLSLQGHLQDEKAQQLYFSGSFTTIETARV